MYIPAAINLLQVSLSSLTGLFGPPHEADSESLNPHFRQRFATLTPYHDRLHVPGVWSDLPSDCAVDQVMLVCIQVPLFYMRFPYSD